MDEINSFSLFQRVMRGWWVIAILMIIGTFGGALAGSLLPPLYTAQAEYYVGLNEPLFAAEHKMEYLEYVDRKEPLSAVSGIFYSDDVTSLVLEYAAQHGIELPDAPFWRTFRLDRYYTTWILSVRHTDPEAGAALVNAWQEIADRSAQVAHQHAALYSQLNLEMVGIEGCFVEKNLQDGNLCAGTSFQSIETMLTYLDDLNERLVAEQDASRGVSDATRLEIVRRAEAPTEPSRNSMGISILAGCFLGWLVGLVLVVQQRERGRRK